MTKSEIIAELRRSAVEDAAPYYEVSDEALTAALDFSLNTQMRFICELTADDNRTFFLLVAEALETT